MRLPFAPVGENDIRRSNIEIGAEHSAQRGPSNDKPTPVTPKREPPGPRPLIRRQDDLQRGGLFYRNVERNRPDLYSAPLQAGLAGARQLPRPETTARIL